jgi:hypothetical protein
MIYAPSHQMPSQRITISYNLMQARRPHLTKRHRIESSRIAFTIDYCRHHLTKRRRVQSRRIAIALKSNVGAISPNAIAYNQAASPLTSNLMQVESH